MYKDDWAGKSMIAFPFLQRQTSNNDHIPKPD